MSTSDKLLYANETKQLIKEALREKGVEVSDTDTFRSYANKVKDISTAEDLSVELAEQDVAITELEEVANSLPDAGGDNPLIINNEEEMIELLTETNIGKVVKYIGVSGTYETDTLYLIEGV